MAPPARAFALLLFAAFICAAPIVHAYPSELLRAASALLTRD